MTLIPGDVIETGPAAGVAMGRPDQTYLRVGKVAEPKTDGLSRLRRLVGQA
jgi:2-keto-4-pentenoate hydratase/2-oxohepta-3-ene-1,7-dioic acid hydratase in catechol pathway